MYQYRVCAHLVEQAGLGLRSGGGDISHVNT